jgi:hypothetical protein
MKKLHDFIKIPNLQIMDIEKESVQAKSIENIFNKIIAGNYLNLEKEMPNHGQESSRFPTRKHQNRTCPWHIIIKTLSTENMERILKTSVEKFQVTNKGKPIKITADFS